MAHPIRRVLYGLAISGLCAAAWSVEAADAPLASWNDGAAKQAIVEFVGVHDRAKRSKAPVVVASKSESK